MFLPQFVFSFFIFARIKLKSWASAARFYYTHTFNLCQSCRVFISCSSNQKKEMCYTCRPYFVSPSKINETNYVIYLCNKCKLSSLFWANERCLLPCFVLKITLNKITDQGGKKRKTVRFNLKLKQPNIIRDSQTAESRWAAQSSQVSWDGGGRGRVGWFAPRRSLHRFDWWRRRCARGAAARSTQV